MPHVHRVCVCVCVCVGLRMFKTAVLHDIASKEEFKKTGGKLSNVMVSWW